MNEAKVTTTSESRVEYFDVLRVIATFAVMILHIAASKWYAVEVTSFEWNVLNVYDSVVRWSVPIFVMISGALFLNRSHTIKKIFSKNILRIVTAFAFWSVIYAIIAGGGKKEMFFNALGGHYHMWFLFMIVGLYLIVPLLQELTKSKILTKYFLVLSFVFAFLFPQIIKVMSYADSGLVQKLGSTFNAMVYDFYFYMGLGYVFYFVAGAYLKNAELKRITRWIIYALGILGFAATIYITARVSVANNEPTAYWYGNFTINVLLQSIAVFVFAKYNLNLPRLGAGARKVIRAFSKYSFGAYLVHAMIIEFLNRELKFHALTYNPVGSVLLVGVIVFACSFAISAIINQIPVLKKYIV